MSTASFGEYDEAATEIGNGGAEKRESDARVVHGNSLKAGLGSRRILHGKATSLEVLPNLFSRSGLPRRKVRQNHVEPQLLINAHRKLIHSQKTRGAAIAAPHCQLEF